MSGYNDQGRAAIVAVAKDKATTNNSYSNPLTRMLGSAFFPRTGRAHHSVMGTTFIIHSRQSLFV